MGGEKLLTRYSSREELLSAVSHLLGAAGFLIAGYWLVCGVSWQEQRIFFLAQIFYWFSLVAMFGASAAYHLVKSEAAKQFGRKCDHCAIYVLITGTYAPLMTGLLADWRGYAVLGALLFLTVLGIVIKFCCSSRFHRLEVVLYLLMGWMCVLVMKPLIAAFDPAGFKYLISGGVVYTAGVVFYAIKKEFFHAVWHLFVLAGAVLQFLAVLTIK